jgi:hypothetical protein
MPTTMINTANIKPHLKVLFVLLLLQFLYRTLFFFLIPMPGGFDHPAGAYLIYMFFFCGGTPGDIFISLPIIAMLIYSLYKILLGLSYQKCTTSGRLALLLAFIFIYEFLSLSGVSFKAA